MFWKWVFWLALRELSAILKNKMAPHYDCYDWLFVSSIKHELHYILRLIFIMCAIQKNVITGVGTHPNWRVKIKTPKQ